MSDTELKARTADQMVDGLINPLANVLNQLIAVLAAKGVLSKEEAIGCVASAAVSLEDERIDEDDGEVGREMLMRMIKSLDGAIEPGRPLAAGIS